MLRAIYPPSRFRSLNCSWFQFQEAWLGGTLGYVSYYTTSQSVSKSELLLVPVSGGLASLVTILLRYQRLAGRCSQHNCIFHLVLLFLLLGLARWPPTIISLVIIFKRCCLYIIITSSSFSGLCCS